MGEFLQAAIFPGSSVSTAQAAVEQAAQKCGFSLDLELCRYAQRPKGAQALLAGDMGFEALAEALSQACSTPVMLLYIYDGDFWGYNYYSVGRAVDRFSSCPGYFGGDKREEERLAGNPYVLLRDFPGLGADDIDRYFPHLLPSKPNWEELAYPEDQYPYGSCWQMTDFMARLGFPWAFDGEDAEPAPPPQPTLEEILEQALPPLPFCKNETFPLVGSLPTALSRDFILDILGQEEFAPYRQKTPQEILEARREAKLAFGTHLNSSYVEPKLCILSAFCALWLGNPAGAFWELYEAVGAGTDCIELLRARGMAVPQFSKRHIAVKDLTRLMELDPANRDVYLLCRAYFNAMWGQKSAAAQADLSELGRLGTLRTGDPRLDFSAFDPEFLDNPQRFFHREEAQERQRLDGIMLQFDKDKRLLEEKEAHRLQPILEKRRKKKGK